MVATSAFADRSDRRQTFTKSHQGEPTDTTEAAEIQADGTMPATLSPIVGSICAMICTFWDNCLPMRLA